MIVKLPKWVLVNKFPAMYDTESLTAIEQTARIYGKINELIDDYNSWIDTIGETLNTYIEQSEEEHETFKVGIRQEFQDFINVIDLKLLDIEKDIETFEATTNQKITTLANDISQFKSSMTNSFNTLEEYVETSLENFDQVITQFKREIEGAMTELSQNIYKDLGDATTPLIVTIDNGVASHTPRDISFKLEGGANVYLKQGHTFTQLSELSFDLEMDVPEGAYADFTTIADDGVFTVTHIAYDGTVSIIENDIGGGSGGSGGSSTPLILYAEISTSPTSTTKFYIDETFTTPVTKQQIKDAFKNNVTNIQISDNEIPFYSLNLLDAICVDGDYVAIKYKGVIIDIVD